ncbi:hypothetical protein CRUP_028286 [Coryphaenoides rupestris]|nr:hypothetical protein CRUP_028286 [Coryphaenoides rupestris]
MGPTKDLRAIASNFCHLENSGWYWGATQQASGPRRHSKRRLKGPSCSPARPGLLSFPDVPSLVQHYMGPGRKVREEKLEDSSSSKTVQQQQPPPPPRQQQSIHEASVVLKLRRAVYKSQGFPSLQHLTRLTINRHSDHPEHLPLPRPLLGYVKDYPFKV